MGRGLEVEGRRDGGKNEWEGKAGMKREMKDGRRKKEYKRGNDRQ